MAASELFSIFMFNKNNYGISEKNRKCLHKKRV